MESVNKNSENQSVDLLLLKKEVDALQIAIHSQKTPWYKNISTILSIIALLFSLGTTYVSNKRIESQDIQNARIELRGLLQRLVALPRENIEITKKYEKTDSNTLWSLGSYLNQENLLLARQAAEITKRLPPEYVSATEYYSIGGAMQLAYNIDAAHEFYTKAIDISTDLNDKVGALRMRANLLYLTGKSDAGRIDYEKALNIFSDFSKSTYNEYTKKSTHIATELAWAYAEANNGSIDAAQKHISNAEGHLSGLKDSPGLNQLKSQINQAREIIPASAVRPTISFDGIPLSDANPLSNPELLSNVNAAENKKID